MAQAQDLDQEPGLDQDWDHGPDQDKHELVLINILILDFSLLGAGPGI
jgi:hypothetical protein